MGEERGGGGWEGGREAMENGEGKAGSGKVGRRIEVGKSKVVVFNEWTEYGRGEGIEK